MQLTHDTYYRDNTRLSNSTHRQWMECAAAAAAMRDGRYAPKPSEPMLVGSYVDVALLTPERMEEFIKAHADDILKGKGQKRTAFELADRMIAVARADEYFMLALRGEHQVIVEFDLFGAPWKAMLDVADPDNGYFGDLKTVGSFAQTEWSEELRLKLPFYDRYWTQFAVYREAYKAKYGTYPEAVMMAAVSRQEPPDIGLWSFDDEDRFQFELEEIERTMPQVQAWRTGAEPPRRCGTCEYCRMTKKLSPQDVQLAINMRRAP